MVRLVSFGWDFKPRFILATHAFDLVGIKRSWHSTQGGSVIVGVERVSYKQIPSMQSVNGEESKSGQGKMQLIDD